MTANFLEAGGSILTICDSQNYLYFEIYFYLKEIKVLRDKFLSPSPRPDSKLVQSGLQGHVIGRKKWWSLRTCVG